MSVTWGKEPEQRSTAMISFGLWYQCNRKWLLLAVVALAVLGKVSTL